ncbi:DUF2634 domain-containing protein [Gorillibacterium sp. sgz500922]|uniref:DUF2634 domain-containing protein n=1 Tax=Gorillibacterium sp. sgz500922 TaxID=3446694 RepID=UPI003F66A613
MADILNDLELQQPSRTYRLDPIAGRIAGWIANLTAVKQAVYKILSTERYAHSIYDADYGVELADLIGQEGGAVQSELARRIKDALMQDDRIQDVTDFRLSITGESLLTEFSVVTIYGIFSAAAARGNANV